MADSDTLKVMSIFEACAKLKLGAEITCLSAHIYHRFFKLEQICKQYHSFDIYTVAAASIKLAHRFYEQDHDQLGDKLVLAMIGIIHPPDFYVNPPAKRKLIQSIDLMARFMAVNLDFQINHKDTRWMTPGLLHQRYKDHRLAEIEAAQKAFQEEYEDPVEDVLEISSSDDEDDALITSAERMLIKNDKSAISSHRYLAHYLITIKMLVKPEAIPFFSKIANLAWTVLSDFHWSPCVTGFYSNHLACACLMLAIDILRDDFKKTKTKEKIEFWRLIDKKWNLIFCDDFSNELNLKAMDTIIEQYKEYERIMQHELSTHVIDPLRR